MASRKVRLENALLPEGWRTNITVDVDVNGKILNCSATGNHASPKLKGFAIPAMLNVHSHAHQRLMAGLAEKAGPGTDSFWTWREIMYGFALRLGPDDLEAVAA